MSNTVLLRGKGMGAALFFHAVLQQFPDATWYEPKLKWWQSSTRYEIRMQNLTHVEIQGLKTMVEYTDWPLTTLIKMEVF